MIKHRKSAHEEKKSAYPENPYHCLSCPGKFPNKASLTKHMARSSCKQEQEMDSKSK